MAAGTCGCGRAIPYAGRGRPRTRCDICKPRHSRTQPARRPPAASQAAHLAEDPVNELIRDHLGLLEYLARDMQRRAPRADVRDLVVDGYRGLVQAAKRFDPSRGLKFSTYAIPRIRGAMVDELRAADIASRGDRKAERAITRARYRFAAREHRFPTAQELAAEAKLTDDEFAGISRRMINAHPLSLEEPLRSPHNGEDFASLAEVVEDPTVSLERALVRSEDLDEVGAAIGRLSAREQMTLRLYYWEEYTLREIAEVLGVTESRVSQLKTRACEKLRALVPPDLMEAA